MKCKNFLAMLLPMIMLGACATYHDDRTVEIKKENLDNVLLTLHGEYRVKDSRNDQNKITFVRVVSSSKAVAVELSNNEGMGFILNGVNCTGYYGEYGKHFRLFCDNTSGVTSAFFIEKLAAARAVTDGAMIGGFKPMTVEEGSYLINYSSLNGRPYYFVLEKK